MNRGKKSLIPVVGGYTIVEVLIFLAVSGTMFFAAMTFVSGKQAKAEFLNAVRDFESKIGDIANDVSTGYYIRPVDFSCDAPANTPRFSDTPTDQGMNGDCIYVGTVLRFGSGSGERDSFTQIAMAGLRQKNGQDVKTLADANPQPIYKEPELKDAIQKYTIGYGATILCVDTSENGCDPGPGSNDNAAIGFFTTFGGVSPSGQGSSIQADIVAYENVNFSENINGTLGKLQAAAPNTTIINNVVICLQSGGTKQYALIKIGGTNSGSSAITTEIKGYSGSAPSCN